MTALSVARTIARSEGEVVANSGKTELEIARILALGPDAAALVKGTGGPPPPLPGSPDPVTNVGGTAASDTDFTVTWTLPPGGAARTSVFIYFTMPGQSETAIEQPPGTTSWRRASGLSMGASGSTFPVAVAANNAVGLSARASGTITIP